MQQHTNGNTQPLPLFDAEAAARWQQSPTPAPPGERDHEDAVWYRLVTTIASCYTYVLTHTGAEACRFTLSPAGVAACYLATAKRWEVTLPEAAYSAFPVVVDLWRAGGLNRCEQVISLSLDGALQLPDGTWTVDVLPAVAPDARTRTVARR